MKRRRLLTGICAFAVAVNMLSGMSVAKVEAKSDPINVSEVCKVYQGGQEGFAMTPEGNKYFYALTTSGGTIRIYAQDINETDIDSKKPMSYEGNTKLSGLGKANDLAYATHGDTSNLFVATAVKKEGDYADADLVKLTINDLDTNTPYFKDDSMVKYRVYVKENGKDKKINNIASVTVIASNSDSYTVALRSGTTVYLADIKYKSESKDMKLYVKKMDSVTYPKNSWGQGMCYSDGCLYCSYTSTDKNSKRNYYKNYVRVFEYDSKKNELTELYSWKIENTSLNMFEVTGIAVVDGQMYFDVNVRDTKDNQKDKIYTAVAFYSVGKAGN